MGRLWSLAKMGLAAFCLWGLVFSLVTIARLGVAFDYDDTLVVSAPAFQRGAASAPPESPAFWSAVNRSYDLERPKLLSCSLAWLFRFLGFRVAILASRPPIDGEALSKDWRHLAPGRFFFAGQESLERLLRGGHLVLFFGDGDPEIEAARKAKIFAVRIRRGAKSPREDYHPGTFGEPVLPFSQY